MLLKRDKENKAQELRVWDYMDELKEESPIWDITDDFSLSGYVGYTLEEALDRYADDVTPIYKADLWKQAQELDDYRLEQAMEEVGDSKDIYKVFAYAIYMETVEQLQEDSWSAYEQAILYEISKARPYMYRQQLDEVTEAISETLNNGEENDQTIGEKAEELLNMIEQQELDALHEAQDDENYRDANT